LWGGKEQIFDGTETGSSGRLCRLLRGRKRIRKGSDEYDCANRLSLLFIGNDVEYLQTTSEKQLASGRGRKTIALETLAEDSSIPLATIKEDYKRGRNYMKLLAEAGPGSLLELGSDVAAL
jgi:hypothetical protein